MYRHFSLIQNDDARASAVGSRIASPGEAASGFAANSECIVTAANFGSGKLSALPNSIWCRRALHTLFVLGTLLAIEGVVVASGLAAPSQFGTKTVLFISSERSDMPAMREIEEAVRAVFHESSDPEIDFFPEYLDFARFPIEQSAGTDIQYLRERYAGQQIDLVLVATGFALEFVLSHRDELFPKAPIVFCAAADREIIRPSLPPDVTGVTGHFDIERTLKLIFTLQPNVTEIVCVGGTSGFDRFWENETRKVLERFADRTEVRWIADESLDQTASELSKLPSSAAVFYISMLRDGDGHSMTATDAVRDLCRTSKAPVYGFTAHFLDAGTVGGAVFDFRTNGQRAADLVLKVLRGQWVPVGSPELEIRNPLAVNWTALRKWHLSESRVPSEAEIRYLSPSLWETHRTLILWTIFVVLIQSALIVGWLAQRLWRRRAESLLLESEERFRSMADAAPVLIWMSGADKLCTFFNRAWLKFTGRQMEQELGNGWAEGVHADDFDKCQETYVTAFDARKPFVMQYRLRRSDGEYRFVTDNGMPRFGTRGDFRGYIGACLDITDSLKQQKALHEFEERVALAADAAHLGAWELKTETNELWMSDKARELFQFGSETPITYKEFQDRVHPEDRASRNAAVREAIKTQGGYELEYRALLPDGTVRWINGRARCVSDESGKLTRLLGVSMDVTDRKEAQELFQLANEASSSGTLLVDGQGRIVLVNAQTEKLFNYWRDELIGKPVEILVPSRFTEHLAHREKFVTAPEARMMGAGRELFGRRKDGSEFPVEIGLNPIQTPHGILVLATVMDISPRKRAEEEARRQRDQINLLSRVSLLGEMTASLAHELNQPLSAIVSNANAGMRFIDKDKADPETLREILVDVEADGRRANEIIRNVRNTIKRGDVIRQALSLNDIVTSVAHMVRSDAAEHSCEVNVSLANDLPAVVADPTQIQQVLINLVGNAFEAMRDKPANKRKVELTTEKNGDETICVAVRDYGVGLSDATRGRLFEQFFTTKEEGLGMGLAIVRSIIEAHGGTIEAENMEGGGARFHFALPISKEVPK